MTSDMEDFADALEKLLDAKRHEAHVERQDEDGRGFLGRHDLRDARERTREALRVLGEALESIVDARVEAVLKARGTPPQGPGPSV